MQAKIDHGLLGSYTKSIIFDPFVLWSFILKAICQEFKTAPQLFWALMTILKNFLVLSKYYWIMRFLALMYLLDCQQITLILSSINIVFNK